MVFHRHKWGENIAVFWDYVEGKKKKRKIDTKLDGSLKSFGQPDVIVPVQHISDKNPFVSDMNISGPFRSGIYRNNPSNNALEIAVFFSFPESNIRIFLFVLQSEARE